MLLGSTAETLLIQPAEAARRLGVSRERVRQRMEARRQREHAEELDEKAAKTDPDTHTR